MGPLRNSDGSAEWTAGSTPRAIRLACSVNGPLEVKIRDELPQQASLEVVYRRNIGVPMIRERLIQEKLHTCLLAVLRRDLLPRSLVQVVVQLIEGDIALEAEISEGVNVMCCALLDAGVPMSGVVAATSYGISAEGEIVRLEELTTEAESMHAVAYRHVGEESQLVMCESTGQFSDEQLFNVLQHAERDTQSVVARIQRHASTR